MANQYVNKVQKSTGETLIDLTGDNVTAADVLQGVIFHLPSGEPSVGTGSGGIDGDDLAYGGTNATPIVGVGQAGYAVIEMDGAAIVGRGEVGFTVL